MRVRQLSFETEKKKEQQEAFLLNWWTKGGVLVMSESHYKALVNRKDKHVRRSSERSEQGREQHPQGQPHGIFELVSRFWSIDRRRVATHLFCV